MFSIPTRRTQVFLIISTLGFDRVEFRPFLKLEVLSLKLTYPPKIDPWKRRFLLETIIFRAMLVLARECSKYHSCVAIFFGDKNSIPLPLPHPIFNSLVE